MITYVMATGTRSSNPPTRDWRICLINELRMLFRVMLGLAGAYLAATYLAATYLAATYLAATYLAYLAATYLAATYLAATYLAATYLDLLSCYLAAT